MSEEMATYKARLMDDVRRTEENEDQRFKVRAEKLRRKHRAEILKATLLLTEERDQLVSKLEILHGVPARERENFEAKEEVLRAELQAECERRVGEGVAAFVAKRGVTVERESKLQAELTRTRGELTRLQARVSGERKVAATVHELRQEHATNLEAVQAKIKALKDDKQQQQQESEAHAQETAVAHARALRDLASQLDEAKAASKKVQAPLVDPEQHERLTEAKDRWERRAGHLEQRLADLQASSGGLTLTFLCSSPHMSFHYRILTPTTLLIATTDTTPDSSQVASNF
jgi:hypothetical protein